MLHCMHISRDLAKEKRPPRTGKEVPKFQGTRPKRNHMTLSLRTTFILMLDWFKISAKFESSTVCTGENKENSGNF